MNWLFEDQTTIIAVGAAVGVILGAAWWNTRQGKFLACIGGTLVVTLLLMLVEYLVVTPKEEVQLALRETAAAVGANNVEGVVSHIAPDAPNQLADQVRKRMGSFRFSHASVGRDFKVELTPPNNPTSAKAHFTGRIELDGGQKNELGHNTFLGMITVQLTKRNGRWLIIDYKLNAPQVGEP